MKISWTLIKPKLDPKYGAPCTRSSHGLSAVQNGSRLILYGGEHVARTPLDHQSACWAVDLNNNSEEASWRCIDSPNGPPERVAHAQAVHKDKYLYIFGGRAGITMNEQAMNDIWMLDASGEAGTEKWTKVSHDKDKGDEPPEARSFHRMICVEDSLYVFGGCGAEHGRLADLHRFDLQNKTWHKMGTSTLRGRGGPNLLPIASNQKLAVVAGFAGEETADGHCFDLASGKWDDTLLGDKLQGLRPRSVCVCGSFPSVGVSIIFGGEVDPSDRGHEGAGGFENDLVVLDEKSGALKETIQAESSWPCQRGWSDAASMDDGEGAGKLYVFGGLTGDDANPQRLDDLWRLDLGS